MMYIVATLIALLSYFLGSISGAILVSKRVDGDDIRNKGSKNAGTTNMLRIYGKKAAALTFLIDILKGVVAVLIAVFVEKYIKKLSPEHFGYVADSLKYIAAVFVVLGHDFPIYFGFKGGKGVATSIAAIMVLDWKIGLVIIVTGLIIMIATRYVSLGSVISSILYPFMVIALMIGRNNFNIINLVSAVILSLLIIIKHKSNIKRLKNGTENKLFSKNKN